MAHYRRSDKHTADEPPDHADLVIVGAGMSGLYIAWRVLLADPSADVVILDQLSRTGGRLDSDVIHFPDHEDVKEEEGGMRFTFDLMDDLMALFALLDLDDQIVPFPMNSGGNNRLYYRGRAFTQQQAEENDFSIWSELYDLEQAEQGVDPTSMINAVFHRILAENPDFTDRPDDRTPKFWQDFRLDCTWNETSLKDWTLWNLLESMGYSNEAITMLYRVLGFNGTFLSEMNAGEAFQLLEDFPSNPGFKTLSNGFSTLPNALVDRIGMERIHLETNVHRVAPAGHGYSLDYTRDGRRRTISADRTVLALPRLALEKLFIASDVVNTLDPDAAATLWSNLQTTTDQALLKINLYYPYAWWGSEFSGQPPVSFGPNFSDLPLGSVYPFYAIDEQLAAAAMYQERLTEGHADPSEVGTKNLAEAALAKYHRPAALTIYCDYLNINFWQALQDMEPKFHSTMQDHYSTEPQSVFAASAAVVAAATTFFGQLFNTHFVPAPVLTSARIWRGSNELDPPPEQNFGFGVHQWGLHADDRQVIADMIEPFPNLFTCGEAFSDYQGWVEGALRSADLVLNTDSFGNMKPISDQYCDDHQRTANDVIREKYQARADELIAQYIDPGPPSTVSDTTAHASVLDQGDYGVNLTFPERPDGRAPRAASS